VRVPIVVGPFKRVGWRSERMWVNVARPMQFSRSRAATIAD
jgi:hypothetical protein